MFPAVSPREHIEGLGETKRTVSVGASHLSAYCFEFEIGFPIFSITVTRCQRLLPPFNGFFVGQCGDTYGSRCVMGCNEGYYLNGSATTTCLVKPGHLTGYWDTLFPTCKSKLCFSLAGQLLNVVCAQTLNYINSFSDIFFTSFYRYF